MPSRDDLLQYYERELTFLRYMGKEFAEKYPKIAGRLQLESDRCEDPHVERLLEGFAFLAARVHMKVDDDFPEITQALLDCVYPHYLRPVPSSTVVQFHLDERQASAPVAVPRDAVLYSRTVEGLPCKFRTCYETQVLPLRVTEAEWKTPDRLQPAYRSGAAAVARVVVQCFPDVKLEKLGLESLRFYLSGEDNVVHTLYELLCNNCVEIAVRDLSPKSRCSPLTLRPSDLHPVGFEQNESLLPYTRRSFDGYRLLQEYFVFPKKFLFVELGNLQALSRMGFGGQFEILFLISGFEHRERQQALEQGVNASTFRLGCSPIVNLFSKEAEPIELDQTRSEYAVIPDLKHRSSIEVFSVDEVRTANPRTGVVRFERFYGYRHANSDESKAAFWYTARRPAGITDDQRTEIYLTLVDRTGRAVHPNSGLRSAPDTVTVRCTCTNYRLPSELLFGNEKGDFQLEGAVSVDRIVCLHKPTPSLRPPIGKDMLWRLVSQLSLNYLSLVENREALQNILQLYNFSESVHFQKQILGITKVEAGRHYARLISEEGVTSARGIRVHLELDEDQFVGGGAYLFASVLERFLGGYVSLNSFSQLVATTKQRKEVMREWPLRAGRLSPL
jgi:type VI secretion system protein ImpG